MCRAVHASSRAALREPPHALPALVVVLAILAPALSTFITATVLPSAIVEIGGVALYAWASTAYAVGSILGSAGSSVAIRRAGIRRAFGLAALAFAIGAGACAAAPSMLLLVAGRAVQGLGGGMLIAAGHSLVREVFPEPLWPRMLATISVVWGVAALGGPALGGVLAGRGLWRTAFWAMAPFAVAAAALTWRILGAAPPRDVRATSMPFGRLALICAGVLCIGSIANVEGAAARLALFAMAVVAIGAMLRLESRAATRLLPSSMLSPRRPIGRGFWMIFLMGMSTTPGGVYAPLLVQVLHHISPAAAGYLYATQSISWTLGTLVSARATGAAVRAAVMLGPLLTASGFVGLWLTMGAGPVAGVAASLLLVGGGIGTCWAHVGTIILAAGRADESAVTASMIPSTQLFAVALGSAVSGVIANAAGLAGGATPPVAALAAEWLYGSFIVVPLVAVVIASGLRPSR
jgi:Major Facilitator Superfamily